MQVVSNGRKHQSKHFNHSSARELKEAISIAGSTLIQGENLEVMQILLEDYGLRSKIDLVYIDPPFATNTVFRGNEQRTAHVSSSLNDEIAYTDQLLGSKYVDFLKERLLLIKELMSSQGSIYLHIDYKIGHYVKVMMDEVFGINNFRNDITRIKCNPKNFHRRAYGNIKDMILFYTKTDRYIWHEPKHQRAKNELERLFTKRDANGRYYTTNPLHAPGDTHGQSLLYTGGELRRFAVKPRQNFRYVSGLLSRPYRVIVTPQYDRLRLFHMGSLILPIGSLGG